MTTSAKYPAAVLALADVGGEMPGFNAAVLSGSHNNTTTTITLTATVPTAWPTAGWVTIESEIIQYAGKSGATLTSCTRGSQSAYGNSVAATHADQSQVIPALTPQAWNQIVADLIAAETQLFGRGQQTAAWPWYWSPGMSTDSVLTGTGAYTLTAGTNIGVLATGATSASGSSLRQILALSSTITGVNGTNRLRHWAFTASFVNIDANTDARVFITDENAATLPSLTVRHVGLRASTTSAILFSTADGTTEQTTDVTAYVTAAAQVNCVVTFDGTTARLYINGVGRATHATNVPTVNATISPIFRAFITNTAAANKQLYVGPMKAEFAST